MGPEHQFELRRCTYTQIFFFDKCGPVNVFSFPHDFLFFYVFFNVFFILEREREREREHEWQSSRESGTEDLKPALH